MRSRTSRESGSHDGRSVRTAAARGGAGLSRPSRHAARGAVASHRRGARGAAAPDHRASSRPAVGGRNRGRARAGRRHRALERDGLPAEHRRRRPGRAHHHVRLSARRRPIPHPHRGAAHGLPRGNPCRRAHGAVFSSGPRPAQHDATHARLAGGSRRQAEELARRPGAGAGTDRPAPLERRSRRRAAHQSGVGATERVAAGPDGKPARSRFCTRTRSIVMQGLQLLVAATLGWQHPVVAPHLIVAPVQAQATVGALDALGTLEVLDALDALDTDEGRVLQDEQDPTDSLWRAAQRALNRADYQNAANLYGDLARRYPAAARAGDALYWAAFALYKNDNLDRARSLLVTQQQRYQKAATLRDGDALLARVQAALAKQGDGAAAEWIRRHAQPAADTGGTRGGNCPGEDDDDDLRVAALNGLLQMDATSALPILKKVLAKRDACSAGLRRKAVFIVSQKRGGETEDILLDVARNDPDAEVRQQAVFWLSQVGGGDNGRWLMDIALNEREPVEMRKKALFWVGQTGGNLEQLAGLYDRMQNQEMKEQLIFVYSQRHEAAALDALIRIAKTEQNKELRKKAIFWLGQSHDPRAAQVLLEIINP